MLWKTNKGTKAKLYMQNDVTMYTHVKKPLPGTHVHRSKIDPQISKKDLSAGLVAAFRTQPLFVKYIYLAIELRQGLVQA